MATIQSTYLDTQSVFAAGVERLRWVLGEDDDGKPATSPIYADRSVQIDGVFGGATVVFEGRTADDHSWATMTDPQGLGISATAATLKALSENPWSVRPRVIGGDGTTNIIVTLMSRRNSNA